MTASAVRWVALLLARDHSLATGDLRDGMAFWVGWAGDKICDADGGRGAANAPARDAVGASGGVVGRVLCTGLVTGRRTRLRCDRAGYAGN